MNISKTTMTMAERRGIDLWFHNASLYLLPAHYDSDKPDDRLMISLEDSDHDGHVLYRIADDGLFFVAAHGYDSEDWPLWIRDEKHLRTLLDAMVKELNS